MTNDPRNPEELFQNIETPKPGEALRRRILESANALDSQTPARREGWKQMLPWLAGAAAVLMFVLYSLNSPGWNLDRRNPDSPHSAGEDLSDFSKVDLNKCRYVGIIGESAILEIPDSTGKPRQIHVKAGQRVGGMTIAEIQSKWLTFENDAKERMRMSILAAGIKPEKDIIDKPFVPEGYFTISGKITGPNMKPANEVRITALPEKKGASLFVEGRTAKDGTYTLVCSEKIIRLQAISFDNDFSIVKDGVWEKDSIVDFNIQDLTFEMQGRVIDAEGNPSVNQSVVISPDYGFAFCVLTNAKGEYSARTNVRVLSVSCVLGKISCWKFGPWDTSTTVDFDLSKTGMIKLGGTITDINGNTVSGTIHALNEKGLSLHQTQASEGKYELQLAWEAHALLFVSKGGALSFAKQTGPWKKDSVVDFDLRQMPLQKMEFSFLDLNGKAIPAPFYADFVMEDGSERGMKISAESDKDGIIHIASSVSIRETIFSLPNLNRGNAGPFETGGKYTIDAGKLKTLKLSGSVGKNEFRVLPNMFVSFYDLKNECIGGVQTDAAGNYSFICSETVGKVHFSNLKDISVMLDGNWNKDSVVDFPWKKCGIFVLDGHVKDMEGKAVPMAPITFYNAMGKYLTKTISDKNGRFHAYSFNSIAYASCIVNGIPMQMNGPWNSDGSIHFDASKADVFKITGSIFDEGGKPCSNCRVNGFCKGGKHFPSAISDEKGKYKLRSALPMTKISFNINGKTLTRVDLWDKSATLDINLAAIKGNTIQGTLSYPGGYDWTQVCVQALNADGECVCRTLGNAKGEFALDVFDEVSKLRIETGFSANSLEIRGPFHPEKTLEIDLSKKGFFKIRGKILEQKKAASGACAWFYPEGGSQPLGSANSDSDGSFSFLASRKIVKICVDPKPGIGTTWTNVMGIWDKESELQIQLGK